ncbi:MAG: CAT RNA binding domain-containing protein [Coprobacillus cateniformis]
MDDKGNEFIARGKGIGFHELPYEIKLSQIERTYYNVDKHFFDVMVDISDDLIILTTKL